MDKVVENIRSNRDVLRAVIAQFSSEPYSCAPGRIVCLKHEGFQEEREWRAIYAPKFWPSSIMESATEIVAGIPQVVYKIPLDARVSGHLADLEFATMFDRLIVGPTPYVWPMYDAFVGALVKAGVADAAKRLFASGIPIRA